MNQSFLLFPGGRVKTQKFVTNLVPLQRLVFSNHFSVVRDREESVFQVTQKRVLYTVFAG